MSYNIHMCIPIERKQSKIFHNPVNLLCINLTFEVKIIYSKSGGGYRHGKNTVKKNYKSQTKIKQRT